MYKHMYEKSGISKVFACKTFDNYNVGNKAPILKAAKDIAIGYVKSFDGSHSLAMLGQSGAGKTHLCIAILNYLLKLNYAVLYMQYRDVITQLKQCITDEESYQRELNRYRLAPVLYIDDLYKGMLKQGNVNDSEIRIMFEIINYRYLNGMPIIVSSEFSTEKLVNFDEAIGGRIIEMCKGFIVEFRGLELNHRLGG